MTLNTDPGVSQETREIRFMTGTWYTVTIPANKMNDPAYEPEAIYNAYWMGGLPEDVEVHEDEIDHIWEGDSW